MVLECRNYPGIRIGLGRKELTRLKQTTLVSLLREAHPILKVTKNDYTYSDQRGQITYRNGSMIQLIDLVYQPSDPQGDSFGSSLFTHVVSEEVGEINQKIRNVFISRKNRFMNNEYGIVGKSVSTCNPSQNYIKQEYYKPYKELGAGDYQQWEHGQVEINGVMQTAYRAFVKSLAYDNPFISKNYIETLRQQPEVERRRLLEGNWDFADDDFLLFKSNTIDQSQTTELPTGNRFIGVDIADVGNDKTVLTYIENDVIADQFEITVDKQGAVGEQIAMAIIKYAQQHGIDSSHARNIGVDVIGVGASTRDFLRSKGWYVKEFIAGAGSISTFRNLRSENLWNMSRAMQEGRLKLYRHLKTMEKLREQLLAHTFETQERIILVRSKQEIKEVLGVSPDFAESAYIAYWVSAGDNDPRNDPNRVSY